MENILGLLIILVAFCFIGPLFLFMSWVLAIKVSMELLTRDDNGTKNPHISEG